MTRRGALVWTPAAILAGGYLAICFRFHSAWPWALVVHEDGRHTLSGTVFYFEHALEELPLEWLLAWSVAGAALWFAGGAGARGVPGLAFTAPALDVLIAAGAWMTAGVRGSLAWFLQYHTRDDETLQFGSHWR